MIYVRKKQRILRFPEPFINHKHKFDAYFNQLFLYANKEIKIVSDSPRFHKPTNFFGICSWPTRTRYKR